MRFTFATFLAVSVLMHATVAQAGDPVIDRCFVSFIDDIQVAAQEAGLLIDLRDEQGRVVTAQDGQPVRRGMVIAQVNDQQPRLERQAAEAELKAALARSEDDIEVRYSEAAYRVAQAELAAAEDANRRVSGTIPLTEVRRLQLTQHRAFLQIDRSKMERNVAGLNAQVSQASVESANAAIERRSIASPVDGILLTVIKKPGEWVQIGEPVARVARMDRLRVEGFVSASDFNPSDIADRPVSVQFTLARGHTVSLPGQVTFVSPLVQAGNRYRVRAEVANGQQQGQWLLRPGMSAVMTIDVQ